MIDKNEIKRLEKETVMIITNETLKKMSDDPLFEGQSELNENFDYKSFWSIDGKIYQVNRNMYDFVARSKNKKTNVSLVNKIMSNFFKLFKK